MHMAFNSRRIKRSIPYYLILGYHYLFTWGTPKEIYYKQKLYSALKHMHAKFKCEHPFS